MDNADTVKQFIEQRLTWADRWLTFRRQIRAIPGILAQTADEALVDLFCAEFAGCRCLWVLSTHRLYCMEPLSSSKVHIWEGKSQIVAAQNDQTRCIIGLHVASVPDDASSITQAEMSYDPPERDHAVRFANMINMLCFAHCWEQPHQLREALADVARAARDPTYLAKRAEEILGKPNQGRADCRFDLSNDLSARNVSQPEYKPRWGMVVLGAVIKPTWGQAVIVVAVFFYFWEVRGHSFLPVLGWVCLCVFVVHAACWLLLIPMGNWYRRRGFAPPPGEEYFDG